MSDDQETAVFPSLATPAKTFKADAAEAEAAKVAAEADAAHRAKAEARLCILPARPAVM